MDGTENTDIPCIQGFENNFEMETHLHPTSSALTSYNADEDVLVTDASLDDAAYQLTLKISNLPLFQKSGVLTISNLLSRLDTFLGPLMSS